MLHGTSGKDRLFSAIELEDLKMCSGTLIKIRLLQPRLIANIKTVQQRLYVSIKMGMGIFDKRNYIVEIVT